MSIKRAALAAALVVALVTALGGCSDAPDTPAADRRAGSAGLSIAAAFYPLEYVASRVSGERGAVRSLTKPGAEPHDLELSPKDVAAIQDSALVIYLAGFQPAVDDAVSGREARALDVAAAARTDLRHAEDDEHADDEQAGDEQTGDEQAGDEHADDEHADEHDPHFWLDPLRLADVADAVAARLAKDDPSGAALYSSNAAAVRRDLVALDADFKNGLQTCASRTVVTTHTAFGYLARAYRLTQVAISGLDPEAEPKAADIARVADAVRREHVTTVFFEPLVSRGVADTVASETGAKVALLDPIEGINDKSQGNDYLAVMRSNLAALRSALGCT